MKLTFWEWEIHLVKSRKVLLLFKAIFTKKSGENQGWEIGYFFFKNFYLLKKILILNYIQCNTFKSLKNLFKLNFTKIGGFFKNG